MYLRRIIILGLSIASFLAIIPVVFAAPDVSIGVPASVADTDTTAGDAEAMEDANNQNATAGEATMNKAGVVPSTTAIPKIMTLRDAILIALRYNPIVRNAEIQRIMDKFSLRVNEWAFEPQYTLSNSVTYNQANASGVGTEGDIINVPQPGVTYTAPTGAKLTAAMLNPLNHTAGQGHDYNPSMTFTVNQPLMSGFGPAVTLAPLYNAQDTELVNQLTLKSSLISAVTTIIQDYTTVVTDENNLKTNELALAASIATLKEQQAMVKAGRTAPADLVQSESGVATQQTNVQQTRIQLQQDMFTLIINLGIDPSTIFTLPTTINMDDKIPSLADSIIIGLHNNTAYQTDVINLRIAKRNVYVQQDAQRWSLALTATQVQGAGSGGGSNAGLNSLINGQNRSTNAALTLNIPIHNLGLQQQLVNAKITLDQDKINLENQKNTVESNVRSAYNSLLLQKQQLVFEQKAVQLALNTLNIAKVKLKYGLSSPFEVTTLQTDLTTQQLNAITAEADYINTLADFDQVIGTTLDRWNIEVRY